MSDAIIRAAIESRLAVWAKAQSPAIPIAYENMSFKPVTGQCYLRGTLMPAGTLNPSLGGEHSRYHGFYQVDVYVPANGGTGPSSALTKAIEVLFKRPTTIPGSGLNVRINRTPSIGPGLPDDAGFYMVPVTIRYSADDFS
ncbi:DUF4128 domain-containing protein [Janthinobacterium sp. J1-1]|uniref:DUF4128 domain-containing protein n=1 Tax=Janthinobacterium sp. J1-1 TaxID=3065910 RepID=UPI00281211EE|nr:DUF4128 domain-containing protein [Janthinobacterium sp. J1-1]